MKDKLWGAVTLYTKNKFKEHMNGLKAISVDVFSYLNNINLCHWSRHAFNLRSHFDLLLNNLAKNFNVYILEVRDKPLLTMVEMIYTQLMERFQQRRIVLAKVNTIIMPNIIKKTKMEKTEAFNCKALHVGNDIYQVMFKLKTYNINLENKKL